MPQRKPKPAAPKTPKTPRAQKKPVPPHDHAVVQLVRDLIHGNGVFVLTYQDSQGRVSQVTNGPLMFTEIIARAGLDRIVMRRRDQENEQERHD